MCLLQVSSTLSQCRINAEPPLLAPANIPSLCFLLSGCRMSQSLTMHSTDAAMSAQCWVSIGDNGLTSLQCMIIGPMHEPDRRLRSSQNDSLFYPRQVRTKTFKNFYSNRVVSIWNSLPKDLTSFVRQLNSFYYLKFEDSFNCDNVCTWTATVDVRRACDIRIIIINMFQYHILLESVPLCP